MSWLALLGIAVALALDAFAVAVAIGLTVVPVTARHRFRLGFHFGLFQFLMPVLGWFAGYGVVRYIQAYDHWIAFGLLVLVGYKMLRESTEPIQAQASSARSDPTRGWNLIALCFATSLDALAVGFSMAALDVSVWLPSVVIGLVASALTIAGLSFGSRLGGRWGIWAQRAGAGVLWVIGARILWSHLGL